MDRTEAQTRREIIDKSLLKSGWDINDLTKVSLEFDLYLGASVPNPNDPYTDHQFVDYLLLGKDQKPLAVVEAKRTSKDARIGKEQAKQYAENIKKVLGGDLPFVFYTNGYETYFWNMDHYPPRKVYGFPTLKDLERMRFSSKERGPLSAELIDKHIAGRDYQIQAIRTVLDDIEDYKRKFLLVMATGTGKTRVCVGLINTLMRAKWAERVLFLVDRIALRDQALEGFKEYLPDSPIWPQHKEVLFSPDRRIYVSTYPTMLNIIEKNDPFISPFFFDVVVADESHRSIYNTYKNVLSYFDALRVGLTATPTDRVDHDTFELFECDTGVPTFAYTYEDAVKHNPPYLCDFEVLNVRSKFQIEGIKSGELPESIQNKLILEGKELEDINFEGTELEKKVTNSGTNNLIVREFMEECIKDNNGVLPGKSIIFAISIAHAHRLQEMLDTMYPEHKGKLSTVIVSNDPRANGKGGLLDQFKNQDFPRIAISVDMLDTGIDVREVVNLVIAKPVYSFTKFWQMIGRGTRVLDDNLQKRKPWCIQKDKFLIIDCWNNFEYFNIDPKGKEPGAQTPITVRLFQAKLKKLIAAQQANRDSIVGSVIASLRQDIQTLPENNVVVLDSRTYHENVKVGSFWQFITKDKLEYLRTTIAPIMRAQSGVDFKAVRFQVDNIDLSTALLLEDQNSIEVLEESIKNQISELPLAVNTVAESKDLIEQALTDNFWLTLSEESIANLRDTIAPLMHYRVLYKKPIEELHLQDITYKKEWVEFGPKHERQTTVLYKEKVEQAVKELEDSSPILKKLIAGIELSNSEIETIAEILRAKEPYVTEELLQKIYDNQSAKFIEFIKHILGMEPVPAWSESVSQKFDLFIIDHNNLYNHQQIQFLQTLKTYVLQTRGIQKESLISPPFTQLHPKGALGLFKMDQVEEIYSFAHQFAQSVTQRSIDA
jgi:type I restriction enzyme R subunit